MESKVDTTQTDVLVLGAGPAGLTAALYSSRAGRDTWILEGSTPSRLSAGYQIENYPGIQSIDSRKLLKKMRDHAEKFGTQFLSGEVLEAQLKGSPKFMAIKDRMIQSKAVILAPGKHSSREKMIPGEEKLLGSGVSYCVTCDGPLFKGRKAAVVGGSKEAAEDAFTLHQLDCDVLWLIDQKSPYLEEHIEKAKKRQIPVYPSVRDLKIEGNHRVNKIVFNYRDEKKEISLDGVFLIKEIPAQSILKKSEVQMDKGGCVITDRKQKTNLEGVFAAGDITCGGMQVVTAAGEGAVAGMEVLKYLND